MKKFFTKNTFYALIIIFILAISILVRPKLISKGQEEVVQNLKGKTVVTVWMKEASDSETRRYQVDRFNKDNKDNIYIDFQTYKDDYYNLLRTFLASKQKPDIFQYGYYDLVKNHNLLSLNDLNIMQDQIGKENLLYFNGEPIGAKISGNDVKLIWNKEIFEKSGLNPNKPPQTWQEVEEYSKKIKEKFPSITPFEFPAHTWGDLKYSIGEASAAKGNIYTTFWNYKEGKYDFDYATDILNIYKDMYDNKLIDEDFDNKNSSDLRQNFYSRSAAMIVSSFNDKDYFENIIPISFEVGISELPKLNISDQGNYYYGEDYKCLVVNKDIKNKEAVATVYNWFLSNDINKELTNTNKVLTTLYNNQKLEGNKYNEYNNVEKFKNETYDPTIYINYKPELTRTLFVDAIKGNKTIAESIKELNKNYKGYYDFMTDKEKFDFSFYKDKSGK